MRWALLVVPALLAACGPVAETDTLPAPASLVGEYRVAAIDSEGLNAPSGIAVSITGGRVTLEPVCAALVWSYAYRDGSLDIERRQEKLYHPPPVVCDEPVMPDVQRLANALDAVNRAGRTPANGIELSGHGRSVLLFSQ